MIFDTECNMGQKEARALIASASGLILDGVDEIKHNIKTNEGWEFEVTVKVLKRGKKEDVKETAEICATCYSFDRTESRCAYLNEDTTELSSCACWTPKEAEE